MQYTFSAQNGLHTDTEPLQQPAGTYRKLVNGIRTLSGALQNEPGTDFLLDLGKPVLATHVVEQQVAIFSGIGGSSEIGWLREDDTYQTILASEQLAFSVEHRLDVQHKLNFKGEQVLYFTDGTSTGLRFLNTAEVPTSNVAEALRLQAYAKFPIPELVEVGEAGSVPTGVYQFAARLLTGSGNPTSYGLVTQPIPVTNEVRADPTQFDGAPPQTSSTKSITVEFNNVDPAYKLLEIIMLTYVGTTNTQVAYRVGQVPVQARNTVRFTYTGESQHKEQVDVASLSISGVVIESAQHLQEKEGVLVASNLTFSQVDKGVDWQYLANLVQVNYSIKQVSAQDFGAYRDEKIAAEYKSLRRGEAYALAFAPIFRAYQDRTAYHIPAPVRTTPDRGLTLANTQQRTPGTYQSEVFYPTGLGYPQEFGVNTPVRHHFMPTLEQEPFLTADGLSLRILGLKLDFTQVLEALPDNVRKEVVGFQVLRQPRTPEHSTILTQGILAPHQESIDQVGNNRLIRLGLAPWAGKGPGSAGPPHNFTKLGFLSPETTIYNSAFPEASRLEVVATLEGTQKAVGEKRDGAVKDKFYYLFLNYPKVRVQRPAVYGLEASQTQLIPAGVEGQSLDASSLPLSGTTNESVRNFRSYGYLYLKTTTEVDVGPANYNGRGESFYDIRSNATDRFYMLGEIRDDANPSAASSRVLANLTRPLRQQYGSPVDAIYYPVGFVTSVGDIYNGDTFLCQMSVFHSSPTEYNFRSMSYFWCESSINTNYRHFIPTIGKEGDANFVAGTTPYYPKFQRLYSDDGNVPGLFNLSFSLGHARGYNKQYSFSDTTLAYYPIGYLDEKVTSFPNRSVYTPVSLEGEQLDTWRLFLPADYHDIPRTYGPITNTFVLGNTFYHHTTGCLYRSFAGEAQTLNTEDSTQVYLSSGIFFGRPSEPVLTVDGGYAGTQGKWGVTTPQGHFFPDVIQNKLWLFNGKLNDLSKQGRQLWSEQNIVISPDTNSFGYRLFYDYRNERLLFTRIGAYTLSYSANFNSWTGEHTYRPTLGFSKGKKVYLLENGKIHLQRTSGKYGQYLNKPTESFLVEWVANELPKNNKKFDALILSEELRKESGEQVHQESISTIQFWNDRRNTGLLTCVVPLSYEDKFSMQQAGTVQADRKAESTHIAVPCDLVINPSLPILDPDNLGTDRSYAPRMSGTFLHCQISYANTYRYTLQGATLLSRTLIR